MFVVVFLSLGWGYIFVFWLSLWFAGGWFSLCFAGCFDIMVLFALVVWFVL